MRRDLSWSEAGAFGFLVLTLCAFAAAAVTSFVGGPAVALWVLAVLSLAAVAVLVRGHRPRQALRTAPAHMGAPEEHRLLVLAQETLSDESLAELGRRADRIVVVSPAGSSFVHRWASDVDDARAQASRRVDDTVRGLRATNADVAGTVGDEDPVRALEDALRAFGGDEIVVATGPRDAALAERVRERFALPVTHVVA
jgi:uncharacterized membrane protein